MKNKLSVIKDGRQHQELRTRQAHCIAGSCKVQAYGHWGKNYPDGRECPAIRRAKHHLPRGQRRSY